ncbi:MAG: class I SAM-dependent methyltransferase, partial [Saprospiraceae bacterium]|nr:class I SAM-dependent methyltransferase [Saprospiraceae bacterium]
HNIQDHGAGSQKLSKVKTVSQIAKVSSSSKIKGELLYKLSHYFNPDSVLEFGTNLGIGTSYIHLGNPKAQITTVEGDPTLAEIANKNFNTLSNSNITVINDHFDNYLESASPTIRNFPFIFIDGNHTYEATVSYFEKLSNPTLENQVLIFDDIYWNKEMTRAWKDIQKKVTNGFCIDLYSIGIIVHSNKADNVTNCSFINKKWKPLSFGFWG